jgi:3-hydroxybutyryl-CoA dehydratase
MKKDERFHLQFPVTVEIVEGFIRLFRDTNPLHVQDDYARQHGFTGRVVHGNILNGFLSYFVGECLPDKNVIILTQEIQFHTPVYLNDVLEFHAIIADVHESVGSVEFKYHFENQLGIKVAKGKIQIGQLP